MIETRLNILEDQMISCFRDNLVLQWSKGGDWNSQYSQISTIYGHSITLYLTHNVRSAWLELLYYRFLFIFHFKKVKIGNKRGQFEYHLIMSNSNDTTATLDMMNDNKNHFRCISLSSITSIISILQICWCIWSNIKLLLICDIRFRNIFPHQRNTENWKSSAIKLYRFFYFF